MNVAKCIIIALIYMFGNMDVRMFGANRWNWPIFIGFLVGLAAGDAKTGIIMGAELQLIFLGYVNIGMSVMPDAAAGTTLAIAFVILNGIDSSAAIALAMPIALLFQPIGIVKQVILNWFNVRGDKYAAEANPRGIERCLHVGNWVQAAFDFIPMLLALTVGSVGVEALVNIIPDLVMSCLQKTAVVLPALGVAYLMNYVTDSKTMAFVILGFALTSYFSLDSLAVSIFGAVIAVLYFYAMRDKKEDA